MKSAAKIIALLLMTVLIIVIARYYLIHDADVSEKLKHHLLNSLESNEQNSVLKTKSNKQPKPKQDSTHKDNYKNIKTIRHQ